MKHIAIMVFVILVGIELVNLIEIPDARELAIESGLPESITMQHVDCQVDRRFCVGEENDHLDPL